MSEEERFEEWWEDHQNYHGEIPMFAAKDIFLSGMSRASLDRPKRGGKVCFGNPFTAILKHPDCEKGGIIPMELAEKLAGRELKSGEEVEI